MLLSSSDESGADASSKCQRPKLMTAIGIVGLVGFMSTMFIFAPSLARSKQFGKLREPVLSAEKAVMQKETIEIVPNREDCAKPEDNCLWSKEKCCQVTGHRCYLKSPLVGFCNATCTPGNDGANCGQLPESVHVAPVVYKPGTSMFCFSVYTHNTGSEKKKLGVGSVEDTASHWC